MTSAVLTQVPLAAGWALASGLGRAGRWAVAQYARAPLSNTAIAALAGFSLMASANAMFLQEHHHPAPLFGQATQEVADVAPVPVTPAMRPKPATQVVAPVQTTGSLPALPTGSLGPIGNDEVLELQIKLKAMGLLEGEADGLYGPKTAHALKAFEEQQGLRQRGVLSREILAAVRAAPLSGQPRSAAVVTPEPVIEQTIITESVPAETPNALPSQMVVTTAAPQTGATVMKLPAPAPLQPAVQPTVETAARPRHRRNDRCHRAPTMCWRLREMSPEVP